MVLMKITAWSAKTSLLCKSSKTYDITIILSTCKIKLTCHLYHIVNAYEQKKKFFFVMVTWIGNVKMGFINLTTLYKIVF